MRCILLGILASAALVAAAPSEAYRLNEEGIGLLEERHPVAAVVLFREALKARSNSVVLKRNLAAALVGMAEARRRDSDPRDLASVVALLDRAIELHPERLHYRVLRGRARYESAGGVDRIFAREDFAHVLQRDPDHLDALFNLGQIAYAERRLDEAVRLWKHALDLRPEDGQIRARLEKAEREFAVEAAYEELRAPKFVVRYGKAIPRTLAESVLTICETAAGELHSRYQHWPERQTVVTLYSPSEFRSATRLHGWVAGLSDGTIRLTVRRGANASTLRPTIYHEYTHHLIRSIAPRTPPWLHEGLAQFSEQRNEALARARLRASGRLDERELSAHVLRLSDPRLVSRFYDLALAFTHFLHQEGGDRGIQELLRALGQGINEHQAIRRVYGASRSDLFARWLDTLRAG